MLDVKLRKLRKSELLELLLEIEEENEQLADENRRLKEQLEDKKVSLNNIGSIAEASLQLSGALEAAQKAADIYLYNVQDLAEQQERVCIENLGKTRNLCLDYAREVERLCNAAASERTGNASTTKRTRSLEAQVQALFSVWDEAEGEAS